MPTGASLYATLSATTGTELEAEILCTESAQGDEEIALTVTSDAAAENIARPRTVAPATAGVVIRVNSVDLDPADLLGGWQVVRSLDQQLQTWSFSVVLSNSTGPLGTPWSKAGPPTCKKTVDVYGILASGDTTYRVPLIVGGIADSSTREANLSSGYTESVSGVDRGGRYDREKVTLELPPGHGIPRGHVIRSLAAKAGETQVELDPGATCYKEIQLRDSEWLPIASELADTEGRHVMWTRNGYLTWRKSGKPGSSEAAASWTLDERDLDASTGVQVQHHADVLTDVTLTGTEQLTRDTACDVKNTTEEIRTTAIYAPRSPAYAQTSGGYAANVQEAADTEPILTSLIVHEIEERCGVVVWERTTEWGWTNPQAPRYEWDTATTGFLRLSCYTDDQTDDAAPGYEFPVEQWAIVSITEAWHYYNTDGFRRPWESMSGAESNIFAGLVGAQSAETREGDYLGSYTQASSFYAPRAAIKSRSMTSYPLPAWDSTEMTDGQDALGSGEAVDLAATSPWQTIPTGDYNPGSPLGENLIGTSQTVETHVGDATGITRTIQRTIWGWAAADGVSAEFLFGDGMESPEPVETFRIVGSETESYLSTGDATHTRLLRQYDMDGKLIGGEERGGQEGYGPAIPRLNLSEVNADEYEDAAEQANLSRGARRGDTAPISARVTATDLQVCHVDNVVVASMPWAESQQELEEIARRMIDESSAATVRCTLAGPNFYMEPGDLVTIQVRPIGLNHTVRLTRVTWSGDDWGRVTTELEGKLYAG